MEENAMRISRTVKDAGAAEDGVIRGRQGLPAPVETEVVQSKVTRVLSKVAKMIPKRVRLIGALTKDADPEGGSEESPESELDLSNDSIIDAIPEDYQQWLYRVSK